MDKRIVSLAYDVLAILLPVLAVLAAEWLRRKIGVERLQQIQRELAAKQELAALAVRFVEQVYKDLHGEEKLNQALEWLVKRANDIGFSLTEDEARGLIEAALRAFKDEFGEGWAAATE